MPVNHRVEALLVVATLALSVGACSLATVISPTEATQTSISATSVRIHLYMLSHRDYPPDLQSLPLRKGYANQITDGWGRVLIYSVADDGVISLSSLGRDGKQGGTGDDADITRRFRTRREDGSLNIDDEYWIVESEIRDG